MASVAAQIPPSLKVITPYIRIASEHESKNPVIAYWCRFYALDTGLKINKTGDERVYLVSLMDLLEKMKSEHKDNEAITNDLVAQSHVENHALKLFNWADQQDRNSNFDKSVIRAFHAAGYIFDVLANFGELNEDNVRMSRYAKWKAAYIHRCIKEGKQPIPGPLKGDDEGFEEDAAGASSTPPQLPNSTEATPAPTPLPRTNIGDSFDMGLPEPPKPKDESTGAYPKVPHYPQYPQEPVPPQPTPVPVFNPPPMVPGGVPPALGAEQIIKAQKYCKYANSALTYEDVPTAVLNLHKALALLTTGVDPQ